MENKVVVIGAAITGLAIGVLMCGKIKGLLGMAKHKMGGGREADSYVNYYYDDINTINSDYRLAFGSAAVPNYKLYDQTTINSFQA